jgi:hypothetical protein
MGSAMDATVAVRRTAADHARALRLSGPVLCGCALAGAAAYLAAVDPAAPGTHLPACPLHELTGLWCPGCGLTRATHAVLRGHLGAAFGYNLFFPLFLGGIIVGWLAWMRAALARPAMHWLTRIPASAGVATAVALLAFGVLRNIHEFRALAP